MFRCFFIFISIWLFIGCKDMPYQEPILASVIDQQAPQILGVIDGIAQKPYRQETANYRQKLLDPENNLRYEIDPIDEPVGLDFSQTPNIYRWKTGSTMKLLRRPI